MHELRRFLALGACLAAMACSDDNTDSGPADGSAKDAGKDSAVSDASNPGMDASSPGMDASNPGPDASDSGLDASDPGPDASDAAADAGFEGIQAYVNADTGDDQNAGTSEAPFKTVQRAFEAVGENGLVWLQPSTFTAETEGLIGPENIYAGRTVPVNTLLRATDEGVSLGMTLQFPAGGGLEGVDLNVTEVGRVLVSGGTVNLRALTWVRSGGGGLAQGLEVTASGRVTLEPGDDPDHNYVGADALAGFAIVRDTAELTIEGGVVDGASGAGFGNLIDMAGESRLTLKDFTISNQSGALVSGGAAVWMGGVLCTVLIEDSRIDLGNNAGGAACLVQDDNSVGSPSAENGSLTIRNSVLTQCRGSAVQLREGAPEVRIEGSELTGSGGRFGIEAGQIGGDSVKVVGRPLLTLVNTMIRGNYLGGIAMNGGGTLSITGGSVDMNGGVNGRGGIWLEGALPFDVSLRDVSVTDNTGPAGYAGMWLAGDATSTFDLGTAADPGNNTLTGNQPTQVSMRVAAGVVVSAVGNTWTASAQGADADGHYTVAGTLCANANPCDQTTGADVNFTFMGAGSGAALRLAAQ
jgi:hypothetical protein